MVAEFVNKGLSKNELLRLVKYSIIIVYLLFFTISYNIFLNKSDKTSIFDKNKSINPALEVLKNELFLIKSNNKYSDFSFFKLETSKEGWKFIPSFIVALEKDLDIRLSENSDIERASFRQLNSLDSKYIFLICEDSVCLNDFLEKKEGYQLIKNIYSDTYKSIFILHNQALDLLN